MSEGLYAPSPKADCVKHHVKQVQLLVLPRSHRYFKSGLLDTLAIPIIGFALQGMPLPPGDPIDPSIQKRIRLDTLSLRSTPEVERRGLGEGQTDMPIAQAHQGEVNPPANHSSLSVLSSLSCNVLSLGSTHLVFQCSTNSSLSNCFHLILLALPCKYSFQFSASVQR